MAGMALGGMLNGAIAGFRQARSDIREDEEYEALKRRRAQQAERENVAWQQGQEDRTYQLGRRGIVDAQNDQNFGVQQRLNALREEGLQFEAGRRPTLAQQQDAAFALDQRRGEESIATSRASRAAQGQAMSFAKERQDRERKQWGREDIEYAVRDTRDAIAPAFIRGAQTGDWGPLAETWNASPLGAGTKVDSIRGDAQGNVQVIVKGQPVFTGPVQQFEKFVSQAIDPTAALSEMAGRRGAMEDRAAGLGARGMQEPASVRETNELAARLEPLPGEDERARWLRAYKMVNERGAQPLADVHAKIYQQTLKALDESYQGMKMTPEQKQDAAYATADSYVARLGQQPAGGVGAALSARGAPPAAGAPAAGAPAAPAPGAAPAAKPPAQAGSLPPDPKHGRAVAYAVDKAGKYGPAGGQVVRYEDGTVLPVQ